MPQNITRLEAMSVEMKLDAVPFEMNQDTVYLFFVEMQLETIREQLKRSKVLFW